MIIFCPNPENPCLDPTIPTANYSSETPDVDLFFSQRWSSPYCGKICTSTISQEDADLCAARLAVEDCPRDPPRPPRPPRRPDDDPDVDDPCDVIYYNREQSCTVTCPDGLTFTFTVVAGQFAARCNQATADAEAYSYACNRAHELRICLGELASELCVDSTVSLTIPRSGSSDGTWEVVSGSLPTGLSLSNGVISGVTTEPGTFTFSVRFTDEDGNYMQKEYSLCVIDIYWDNHAYGTPLSDAPLGDNYSVTFSATPCATTPLSWQVIHGVLPDGMALDEQTGVLSGVPTVVGTYNFVIQAGTPST